MPLVAQVALGKLPMLNFYSDDFDTLDRTVVGGSIYEMDLAALNYLNSDDGLNITNESTGNDFSLPIWLVLLKASSQHVPYRIQVKLPRDITSC
jgi:UDP-glucose 4-epimerase